MLSGRKIAAGLGAIVVFLAPVVVYLGRDRLMTVDMMQGDEATRAIATLEQRVGHPLRGVSVTIDHKSLRAELQNATSPDVTDRWSVGHMRGLRGLIDWYVVGGPDPVSASMLNAPVRHRAFDLQDANFAVVPEIAAAAVARVALQEPATVPEMSLSRRITSGIQGRIGGERWVVSVRSAHESATAFADTKGHLTGINLTGTLRAQLFDLYAGGQPLLDTVRAFRDAFPGKDRIQQALIYKTSIRFEVPNPSDTARTEWYSSGIDGAYRESYQSELPVPLASNPAPPFTTNDVIWEDLPRLYRIARERLEMPDGEIRLLEVSRDARAVGSPPIRWVFSLKDRNGDNGSIVLDPGGNPRQIDWPRRRANEKQVNLLTQEHIERFLASLRASLDPGSMIMELVFKPAEAIAVVRDPARPRTLTRLQYNGLVLERSSMPDEPAGKYYGLPYDETWLFELKSINAGMLGSIPSFEAAALRSVAIKDGAITAIGIGRHQDTMPRIHDLNVAIRVEGADHQSGRYFADFQGHVLRVENP